MAQALRVQVKADGCAGVHRCVTDFVRARRPGEGHSNATTAFVLPAVGFGEAFEFDWSEDGMVAGRIFGLGKEVRGVLLHHAAQRDLFRAVPLVVDRCAIGRRAWMAADAMQAMLWRM